MPVVPVLVDQIDLAGSVGTTVFWGWTAAWGNVTGTQEIRRSTLTTESCPRG